MKKIIFTLAILVSMAGALSAQVDGKAIGLRFGGVGEISYQQPIGDTHRLELDLGLGAWRMGLTGIYHWVWDLSSVTDGLNWYAGPGAAVGLTYGSGWSNGLYVGIAGQVGIEYNFEFPLQVSLDYRPTIYLVRPGTMDYGSFDGICLAGRYRF